jgi:signal transduction histidine kinase
MAPKMVNRRKRMTLTEPQADGEPAASEGNRRRISMPNPFRWLVGHAQELYAHYCEYQRVGGDQRVGLKRLKAIGWLGALGFSSFYFLRLTRPNPDFGEGIIERFTVIILCLLLALQERWPERLKRYYLGFSYFALTYALVYFSVHRAMELGGNLPSISNLYVTLCILVLLVDYRNIVVMIFLGSAAARIAWWLTDHGQPVPAPLLAQIPAFALITLVAYAFKHSTALLDAQNRLATEQEIHKQRLAALRETLGFMAHEVNTPLATVRMGVEALKERMNANTDAATDAASQLCCLVERYPGEVADILERTQRSALYCQSLVSTFVQSARDAHPGADPQRATASELIEEVVRRYPFEPGERPQIDTAIYADFELSGRRDLMYMVLCTLVKNSLQALRGRSNPQMRIYSTIVEEGGKKWGCLTIQDNGHGIRPEVLEKLTHEPVQGRSGSGSGMGVLFCQRVLKSAGGTMQVKSQVGVGSTFTLYFSLTRGRDIIRPATA